MQRYLMCLTVLLVGCATVHLTPEAAAIRATSNPDVVKGCRFLANVEGHDHVWTNGALVKSASAENALRNMKNNAAKAGANVLYVTSSPSEPSSQHGEAYRCE